jgi:hypothetical protein
MRKITSYKCDFCSNVRSTEEGGKKHEDKCLHNPKNKTCHTCVAGRKKKECSLSSANWSRTWVGCELWES